MSRKKSEKKKKQNKTIIEGIIMQMIQAEAKVAIEKALDDVLKGFK